MPTLRFLLPWLGPAAPALALALGLLVHAARDGRRPRPALLRKADMTDWLLRDIGWKDGRDVSAWRDARRMSRHRL